MLLILLDVAFLVALALGIVFAYGAIADSLIESRKILKYMKQNNTTYEEARDVCSAERILEDFEKNGRTD